LEELHMVRIIGGQRRRFLNVAIVLGVVATMSAGVAQGQQ